MLKTIQPLFGFILLLISTGSYADITVLGAASLTQVLTEIGKQYENKTGLPIKTSFANSAVLAKQIENGIPADIFISADTQWLDYIGAKGKIINNSRRDLLTNNLVLIAPKGQGFHFEFNNNDLASAFSGKLCTGETNTVPVGQYAKQALEKLNLWNGIKARLMGAENVRAALTFVERGECAAGIVYYTDARNNSKIEIIATFPKNSHAPIIYPMALISQSAPAAQFFNYLGSDEAMAIFIKYGFGVLK